MKKSLASLAAISLLAAAGMAFATGNGNTVQVVQNSAVDSGASATSYSGTPGGSSFSTAVNQQRASTSGDGSSVAGSFLGQTAGAAGVTGTATTSTFSAAANISTGSGTGGATASGLSNASVAATSSYNAGHSVSGSATGNTEAVSGSLATTGRNGAAVVGANAAGGFDASASSYRVGIFTTNRGATSTATTGAVTSAPSQFVFGSGSTSLQNEAASNASAVGKSGNVVSN